MRFKGMGVAKGLRSSAASAVKDAFGKRVFWVVFLLIIVGWFSDIALDLIKYVSLDYLSDMEFKVVAISIVTILFIVFYNMGVSSFRYGDNFLVSEGERTDKRVLVLVVSPYSKQKIKLQVAAENGLSFEAGEGGYDTLEEFVENIGSCSKWETVRQLSGTKFQCNWLPYLVALEEYTNITDVIVITTAGEGGSDSQYKYFNRFVKNFMGVRNISVLKYDMFLDHARITSDESKYTNGLPSNDFRAFFDLIVNIFDGIEKINGMECKDVVVNINGGFGFMSATMAAVSVKNGIELHHADTELKSKVVDISAV